MQNHKNAETEIIEGEPITPEDTFWVNIQNDLVKGSVKGIEGAGKQLVAIIAILQGIYLAAISFTDIKESADDIFKLVIFTLPVVLWLLSLFFALRVFKSRKYLTIIQSPDVAKKTYSNIVKFKQTNLDLAYYTLSISFLISVISLFLFLRG